jgi:oligosaccharyl transferase (archaeosortase A-associated)
MDLRKRHEQLELLAVFILGLVLRLYAGRNALQDGNVLFMGYDEFYHMRRILYTVGHFPNTIFFDSYLDYPYGMHITWPPLYDQLSAAVSVVLGQHSRAGIEMVSAIVPTVLGSIAIVAVYFLVREIFDRRIAIMSAFMTALAPYYLQKSMLGETDHHVLEVLLLILALLFLVLALSRKERAMIFAALAGIAMAGMAYTWLGSAAYFGIVLLYAIGQMTLDIKNNVSSKETMAKLLVAFGVTLILTLPFWNTPWLSPSFFGTAVIIAAILILFLVSKLLAERKIHWAFFPISIVVLTYFTMLLFQLLSGFWLFSNVDQIIRTGGDYLFSGGFVGKISEAEPLFARPEILFSNTIFSNLGWNLLFSAIGLAVLISFFWYTWQNTDKKESSLLFLVFVTFTLILTIGQIRFLYLSTITTGILISILFFRAVEKIGHGPEGHANLSKYIVPVLFLVLILPTAMEAVSITDATSMIAGDWYETLNWLEKNSNTTSWYDDPYRAPEYGVMNWWDYGNWILYQAKRPVVANNFQVGIEDSSRFFLSESEETATKILDARRARYIITDYSMLYGKLSAIATWANQDPSTYQTLRDMGTYITAIPTRKLMQTTMVRLHLFDGSSMGRMRLIYESQTKVGGNPPSSSLKIFEYVPGAVLHVTGASGQKVVALVNMTSNQGRKFQYVNEGVSEVRVPYSTENRDDTHAITPYLVASGSSPDNIKTMSVNVTEDDILMGKVIEVAL